MDYCRKKDREIICWAPFNKLRKHNNVTPNRNRFLSESRETSHQGLFNHLICCVCVFTRVIGRLNSLNNPWRMLSAAAVSNSYCLTSASGHKRALLLREKQEGLYLATTYSHRTYRPTTIGAKEFHFRVRNGTGWFLSAVATRRQYSL